MGASSAQAGGGYGQAKFVGDAAPVAGIPLSRLFNAACYVITGIASFVMSAQKGMPKLWPIPIGIGAMVYGLKIAFTRSSYWVSSFVYVITFLAAAVAIGMAAK